MKAGEVVEAGDLPHRVTLQQLARPISQGTIGEKNNEWTNVITVWASVRPASGTEKTIAAQTNALVTHAVKLRWLGSSITVGPGMRFLFRTRLLNILSVLNVDELNHTLICYCVEKVAT